MSEWRPYEPRKEEPRTCFRHKDCDEADEEHRARYPASGGDHHCHNPACGGAC